MAQTIYSVIVSHEAEVHENFLFVNRDDAIAKMEEIKSGWIDRNNVDKFEVTKYSEEKHRAFFTEQYHSKLGYAYMYGEWEYGSVDLVECVLETL